MKLKIAQRENPLLAYPRRRRCTGEVWAGPPASDWGGGNEGGIANGEESMEEKKKVARTCHRVIAVGEEGREVRS